MAFQREPGDNNSFRFVLIILSHKTYLKKSTLQTLRSDKRGILGSSLRLKRQVLKSISKLCLRYWFIRSRLRSAPSWLKKKNTLCTSSFPLDKRSFWTSGHGHYRRNAAHLQSTLTTDYTHSCCVCVYQSLSQTALVLLWHRKQRGVFFFFFTSATQSPAVLLCYYVHMQSYTQTQLCTLNSAFSSDFATEVW